MERKVLGEFLSGKAMVAALYVLRANGYRDIETYTPHPMERFAPALEMTPRCLFWLLLTGGQATLAYHTHHWTVVAGSLLAMVFGLKAMCSARPVGRVVEGSTYWVSILLGEQAEDAPLLQTLRDVGAQQISVMPKLKTVTMEEVCARLQTSAAVAGPRPKATPRPQPLHAAAPSLRPVRARASGTRLRASGSHSRIVTSPGTRHVRSTPPTPR